MLGEADIKLLIENWLLHKQISINSIKSILEQYIKDITEKEVEIDVNGIHARMDLMRVAMGNVVNYYSDKYGRTIVINESKILKILWNEK